MFVCLLLRNAYVTMHGSQIPEYLVLKPPSFEEWTSQGPRARPMPNNSILYLVLLMRLTMTVEVDKGGSSDNEN